MASFEPMLTYSCLEEVVKQAACAPLCMCYSSYIKNPQ